MKDPHTHKGDNGQVFRDAVKGALEEDRPHKKSSSGTPGPATPTQSTGAPRRQTLLGSPAASRSTDIDEREKKKRRNGSLLMP
jgi:hypothetical protein